MRVAAADRWPFHTPGHKRGRGLDPLLAQVLGGTGGAAAFDLTELTGLDELSQPHSVIAEAQGLAASAFGAARTFFSVNGSSAGVAAMIAAAAGPGDTVLLPRNAHRSVVAGLVASGAVPRFVRPPVALDLGVPGPIGWSEIEPALNAGDGHGVPVAVFLVSPTYEGRVADVGGITARLAAWTPRPLLLVDEAHGPHFGFATGFPTPALAAGADAAVHSLHKVVGSLTQGALLHVGHSAPPAFAPERWLTLGQTSSPSYLLMASLDAARRQLATVGPARLARTLALAARARRELARLPSLQVVPAAGGDPTRLCLRLLGGSEAASRFAAALEAQGVYPELVEGDLLVFILTMADEAASVEALINACRRAGVENAPPPAPLPAGHSWPPVDPPCTGVARCLFETHVPRLAIPPRQAFAAPREKIRLNAALGRVSAQTVAPSPPGTLLLIPGEVVDETVLENTLVAARQGLPVPMEIEVVCQP